MANEDQGTNISTYATQEHQPKRWRYDVFLNFTGSDTRESFIGHLYHALQSKGFNVFIDSKSLPIGCPVIYALRKAINESRISIVVLSKKYASSKFCLQELTEILSCKKRHNHGVFPVHYGVVPSDVISGDAIAALEDRYGKMVEVDEWSLALREVANLDGYTFKIGDRQEYEQVRSIVEWVSEGLPLYDVFISVSEKDTHCPFPDFLLKALNINGFKTFTKHKDRNGDQSSQSLVTAIEKSRLSIIVFSENYIHSSSCLDELVTSLSCMKINRQLVWPIFFKVEPSDIRCQKNSFEEIMIEHENKFGHDKVQKWKSAMFEAAALDGWQVKIGDEYDVIEKIVEKAIEI